MLGTTLRLSDEVARLTWDHVEIGGLLEDLLDEVCGGLAPERVGRVRELGSQLLVRVIRSRQRGVDLVYEACQADIGGEG